MARSFEFRFVIVLASHAEGAPARTAAEADLNALNDLGREGWQIAGVMVDPLLPAARLVVCLQRETG